MVRDQPEIPKLSTGKRLVIKIGSALLVDENNGKFHEKWLKSLIEDIVSLYQKPCDIVIVTSGAISLGRHDLGFKPGPLQLEQQQAAAAAGQIRLAHVFQKLLKQHAITAAQILLTLDDSEDRKRYLNAKNTLEMLLKLKAIPIINENDTVATTEIRFGDNDRLAARVAQMVVADRLILLSDIDGLYSQDPRINKNAKFIPVVHQINSDILVMASKSMTSIGSGGMVTKLAAAQIAIDSGCNMVITNGNTLNPLTKVDQGKRCTWFLPNTKPLTARKNWLRHHLKTRGKIIINEGAQLALSQGKSLLSAGVITMNGNFHKGDVVSIYNQDDIEIARGLCNYPIHEAQKIIGKKSSEIVQQLGYLGSEELVHRNNLVLLS